MPKRESLKVKMRIRVYVGDRMLGPGKMELLAHIEKTGSLSAAARKMRMSYMRAWKLVQELNRDQNRLMVETSRGGASGGNAMVTRFGKRVLALYQNMEKASTKAVSQYTRKLAALLD